MLEKNKVLARTRKLVGSPSNDYVLNVVIGPDPPYTDSNDAFLDNIRVIGPLLDASEEAVRQATDRFPEGWKVYEIGVHPEGSVTCLHKDASPYEAFYPAG